MKKSLVLAMAMALGVTASAYAANPFSDVPAGHWAYDSISKLAAAGVIEGYGDDTFRGDRLMTRYEMAQIVAKAMAKGANVDRLAAEFADELDALGVRVAALEKQADNVKITGQVRWNWTQEKVKNGGVDTKNNNHRLRSRLTFTGKVNDNWNYVGLLQNIQNFRNDVGDENVTWQRAYLDGRLGGTKVQAGRFNLLRTDDGLIYDHRFDGVKATYGDKVKLSGYYGKPTELNDPERVTAAGITPAVTYYDRAWGVNAAAKLGEKVELFAGYDRFDEGNDGVAGDSLKIVDAGVKAKFGELGASFTYLHGKADWVENKNGYVGGLTYAGAKAAKPGTWGLAANYYNQGDGTYFADTHTMNGNPDLAGGFKGYMVAGYYTVAKGMVAGVEWYDLKAKEGDEKHKTLWGQLMVTF